MMHSCGKEARRGILGVLLVKDGRSSVSIPDRSEE